MTIYIDTSVLVSTFTREASTARSQLWLSGQDPDSLLISEWVMTEFSAALSVKLRSGAIDLVERSAALAAFEMITATSLRILAVEGSHFRDAARLADQFATGLRAGDALHLAVAMAHRASLHTLDRRLAEAGAALGLRVELI